MSTKDLFKNRNLTAETELNLLADYVSNHQFDNVPFEFFVNAKTDFIATARKMLSNFLFENEIDEVLNTNEAKLMLESEDVKALLSMATDTLNNTFLRDELNDEFTTMDEVVATLIPVPENHMNIDFTHKMLHAVSHAQFGMIALPISLAIKMAGHAAETMFPAERVTFFYRTATGSIVFFNDNRLLFLSDEIEKELTETDNMLSNPDDEFWTTPLFKSLF
ncbi:hypothetical protein [Photobacterium damselae]|uniref:hypothetical protein n=1 Tax=Photobacterium damselae TaxID=38293 RepID=UPI0040693CF8